MSINFSGVTLCGDTEDEIPSFKDCTIYDCKFNGLKNKIVIDIDELNTTITAELIGEELNQTLQLVPNTYEYEIEEAKKIAKSK